MSSVNHGRFCAQTRFLRRQFLQEGGLPFTNVLSLKCITDALMSNGVCWKERIYTPLVTLWVFLGQILSADHSCASAVARLIAHRVSQNQSPCSSETSAYCQARKRLPEKFFSDVARHTGRSLDDEANSDWLWHGRRVYLYDGATVTMPDTPVNQAAYPQPKVQRPGLGFPMARMCAIMSLSENPGSAERKVCAREVQCSDVILDLLFPSYEDRSKSIEPTVGALDDPPSRSFALAATQLLLLLST